MVSLPIIGGEFYMAIPILGIIAEYNPLHKGHLYQIKKARELTKAEAIVVVLSSNFVQRGEPSIINKWDRTKTALNTGVDLVLELPVVFSAHNAGVFANAAIDLLGSTGLVTDISFGLEDPDWNTDSILCILNEEPADFKSQLKLSLDKGLSFVQARANALEAMVPGSLERLKKPNNTLGLAYMLRLRQKNWGIKPLPIQRIGKGHNHNELDEYSSSTAIRNAISRGNIEEAMKYLPLESRETVYKAVSEGRACTNQKKLWNLLRMNFMRSTYEEISNIAEIREGIEFKLKEEAYESSSFDEWSKNCTSKRYTLGRIRRYAIHSLLALEHWDNRAFQRIGPSYIRVLGMSHKGRKLLNQMKDKSRLPIITKYGEAARISAYSQKIMKYELLACEIWNQLIPNEMFAEEHKQKVIIRE